MSRNVSETPKRVKRSSVSSCAGTAGAVSQMSHDKTSNVRGQRGAGDAKRGGTYDGNGRLGKERMAHDEAQAALDGAQAADGLAVTPSAYGVRNPPAATVLAPLGVAMGAVEEVGGVELALAVAVGAAGGRTGGVGRGGGRGAAGDGRVGDAGEGREAVLARGRARVGMRVRVLVLARVGVGVGEEEGAVGGAVCGVCAEVRLGGGEEGRTDGEAVAVVGAAAGSKGLGVVAVVVLVVGEWERGRGGDGGELDVGGRGAGEGEGHGEQATSGGAGVCVCGRRETAHGPQQWEDEWYRWNRELVAVCAK